MAQATNRLDSHADRDRTDRETDDHRDQRLDTPVPVRMVFIRRCRPITNPEDHRNVGHRVGQTVEGVGEHGLRVADYSSDRLGGRKCEVAEQSHPAHAADSRGIVRRSIRPVHGAILSTSVDRSGDPSAVHDVDGITDANDAAPVVHQVLTEKNLSVDGPVG